MLLLDDLDLETVLFAALKCETLTFNMQLLVQIIKMGEQLQVIDLADLNRVRLLCVLDGTWVLV